MTKPELITFQARLKELARRMQNTVEQAEQQAYQATGGEAAGGLSNTPIHMADVGSEVQTQEVGATLLENERYLLNEVRVALERVEKGTYGKCEGCGRGIARARLQAIPYTRYCVACANRLHAGCQANMNEGRPESWDAGLGLRAEGPPAGAPGGPEEESITDRHAAGTPGGGTAVGGLAGTNIGAGEPEGSELEDAMGSGDFDATLDAKPPAQDQLGEAEANAFSGHAGGAVGGTPANKRAAGGKPNRKKSR